MSLLDSEPAELPDALDRTYCLPDSAAAVVAAAHATADLLTAASAGACATLQVEIDTPWAGIARRRLTAAYTDS